MNASIQKYDFVETRWRAYILTEQELLDGGNQSLWITYKSFENWKMKQSQIFWQYFALLSITFRQ